MDTTVCSVDNSLTKFSGGEPAVIKFYILLFVTLIFRQEQHNHVSDLKDFFCAEIGKMKNEIKTEIENFKTELNTEMKTKFDLLEQFNIQTREEIKGVKKAIIDTGTDSTRSQKMFDKLRKFKKKKIM